MCYIIFIKFILKVSSCLQLFDYFKKIISYLKNEKIIFKKKFYNESLINSKFCFSLIFFLMLEILLF